MNVPAPSGGGARVAVLGLGYVGCVNAACLARLGNAVIGVDRDDIKVQAVLAGKAPYYEPGLAELVEEAVRQGRLTATTDLAEALAYADIALICVGTPSSGAGNLETEQLGRVVEEIALLLPGRAASLTIAVRSTVSPGTCEEVVMRPLADHRKAFVVANPEFLREGSAVRDFMEPSLVVIGGSEPGALDRIAGLYRPLGVEPSFVPLRAAELIKCASNAFHALKITFSNEIGTLAAHLGIDGALVMETLCRDTVLNLSAAYLKPGFAFGGSCLSKDLRDLVYHACRLDLQLPLLEAVVPSNERHLLRAIEAVLAVPARRIGVFGLAFKENTDDVRESAVLTLLEHLVRNGRNFRVFDPRVQPDQLYGSNLRYLRAAIPQIDEVFEPDLQGLLAWADQIVIAQKPAPPLAERVAASRLPTLNFVDAIPAPRELR